MSLPKHLVEAFQSITHSRVVSGDLSRDALREFVDLLNDAIPSAYNASAYSVYRFNRVKYLTDKERFIADIKDFPPYDALVLWTDYSNILEHFGLVGKIFLGWDKMRNRYRACPLSAVKHKKNLQSESQSEIPPGVESVASEDVHPEVSVHTRNQNETTSDVETTIDTMESNISDQDIVFLRMANACKRLTTEL